jgi:hypothetical protein
MNVIHITGCVSQVEELEFDTEDGMLGGRILTKTMNDLRIEPVVADSLFFMETPHVKCAAVLRFSLTLELYYVFSICLPW